jgi:AraC family cel operon transcriptional repressor
MKQIPQPKFISPPKHHFRSIGTIQFASPFKNVSAMFNWVNSYYPVDHTHTHYEFLIIMRGKTKHTLNGKSTIMSRGDACLLRPQDSHRIDPVYPLQEFHHITLAINKDLFEKLLGFYQSYEDLAHTNNNCYFFLNDSFIEQLTEKLLIVQNYERSKYEKNVILFCNSLLLNYLESTLNYESSYPDWLKKFLHDLHSPANFSKSLATLASNTPYTHSALARAFKQYMNVSIVKYFSQIKMTAAKRLLRTTNLSMLEISLELGYDSLSTFNHNFKNSFGITPSEYKKTHFNQDVTNEHLQ